MNVCIVILIACKLPLDSTQGKNLSGDAFLSFTKADGKYETDLTYHSINVYILLCVR